MPYPVILIGGTDRLQLSPDGRVYEVGDVIRDLADEQRLSLQQNGVRFSVVPDAAATPAKATPPKLPPELAAIAAANDVPPGAEAPSTKGK